MFDELRIEGLLEGKFCFTNDEIALIQALRRRYEPLKTIYTRAFPEGLERFREIPMTGYIWAQNAFAYLRASQNPSSCGTWPFEWGYYVGTLYSQFGADHHHYSIEQTPHEKVHSKCRHYWMKPEYRPKRR